MSAKVPMPVGARFNRWTVIADAPSRAGMACVTCRCDCGTERTLLAGQLRYGEPKSCGCLLKEHTREMGLANATHGRAGGRKTKPAPEYKCWQSMLQRCLNPDCKAYRDYGARGIKVCERWLTFENFLADVGARPSSDYSIDRRNNDGHYEPDNFRWATRSEQQRNRRPRSQWRFSQSVAT